MKNDKTEQAENSASRIGKFNTADDLLSAYNALESEFTKRCQLIKQLQAKLNDMSAQAEMAPQQAGEIPRCETAEQADIGAEDQARVAAENNSQTAPQSEPEIQAGTVIVTGTVASPQDQAPQCDEANRIADVLDEIAIHAAEYADMLSAIPEVMDACIARYKHRLMEVRASGVAPAGMAVIMPAKRPRTLYEAKLIADDMLK